MAWVAGDQLQGGKYTIEKELGRGRFGITYLVKNRNGDRVVVKILNYDLLRSLTQQERERLETMFWQEAVKLTRCKHKHIVQVAEPFKEGEHWCLIMEYVDGVSLADRRQQILSESEALRYIQQIGEALIVVHENRLIHRDVHPGNIFLRVRDGQPEAVLIDFGLALDFDHILTTNRTKETSEGFTPPELYAKSIPSGAYSDIYSLAATLYVLLTGKTPVSALKRKIDNARLVAPKDFNPQISDRVNQAILTGMKLDPKKRSQSVREWLDLLGLNGETPTPVSTLTPKVNSNWEQKIQLWGVIVAAIAAIGGLLAGVGAVMDKLKPSLSPSPTSVSPSPQSSKIP
ncbi:serine/threonine protein kinase [Calothrix sp. PCC 6303]|uniref:serine/threonine protein kinase n=1 Tax=Calothrix sp. PCC 6303 TaxID=1170562 RepID=UPI0002A01253|nr:serine/threonine-protein kinase [Calothrix sp. PCC 6303]AFZ03216.1 serine/threonine protein kinase [Calothrix sp. PCC 6303]